MSTYPPEAVQAAVLAVGRSITPKLFHSSVKLRPIVCDDLDAAWLAAGRYSITSDWPEFLEAVRHRLAHPAKGS